MPVSIQETSQFMSESVKITVRANGSLRVEGPIVLCDADGKEWDLAGKPAISLCRCGASANRPFCDGSHNRIGFQCAASPAPPIPAPLA
jgi:CDGSH-type Zn-finger protein